MSEIMIVIIVMIKNGKSKKKLLECIAWPFFLCNGDNWPTIVVLKKERESKIYQNKHHCYLPKIFNDLKMICTFKNSIVNRSSFTPNASREIILICFSFFRIKINKWMNEWGKVSPFLSSVQCSLNRIHNVGSIKKKIN